MISMALAQDDPCTINFLVQEELKDHVKKMDLEYKEIIASSGKCAALSLEYYHDETTTEHTCDEGIVVQVTGSNFVPTEQEEDWVVKMVGIFASEESYLEHCTCVAACENHVS